MPSFFHHFLSPTTASLKTFHGGDGDRNGVVFDTISQTQPISIHQSSQQEQRPLGFFFPSDENSDESFRYFRPTPVIESSRSSFDDVASSLAKRATMMLIKIQIKK